MLTGLLITVFLLILALAYASYILGRAGLNRFDGCDLPPVIDTPLSDEYQEQLNILVNPPEMSGGIKKRLLAGRELLDALGDGEFGVAITPLEFEDFSAEWVVAPGASSDRRLLYLHGGAFYMGSAKSHRRITSELSKRTGLAVLAINYRLMPENRRIDTINDSQFAYRWILENGPEGPGKTEFLAVAGDSAGGSLALMVAAWAREEAPTQPNAVVGIAPATDSGLQGPSLRKNIATDPILGPGIGALMKLPIALLFYVNWYNLKIRPDRVDVSPLRADLSHLPPTLLQVSKAEMLYDDSVRYFCKARGAGSPITIQHWTKRAHVFQAFGDTVPEVDEALRGMASFINDQQGQVIEADDAGI